jgi:hypothetical protein
MPCVISSCTWGGGEPRRCPICATLAWVEPSLSVGDAPCPACGHLLWPAQRTRHVIRQAVRQGTSVTFRLRQTLKRTVRRIREAATANKASASKPKPAPLKPATGGVWDAWLDA